MEIRFLQHGVPGLFSPLKEDEFFSFMQARLLQRITGTEKTDSELRYLAFSLPALPAPVYVCGQSSSALDSARFLVRKNGLAEWASVLTISQTAGRGQLRRTWASPAGNLYASIRLPCTGLLRTSAAAPLVGAMLARALRAHGVEAWIKWPNDLVMFLHGKWQKIGGILLEEQENVLLAGVGLNITSAPPAHILRKNHALTAGFLAEQGEKWAQMHILDLWSGLVKETFFCYKTEVADKTSDWTAFAEQNLLWKGQSVILLDEDVSSQNGHTGRLSGLATDGGLCLETGQGKEIFYSGSLQALF